MNLLVAIPALNEERSISSVIQKIKFDIPNASILVIDDGSTDSTAKIARESGAKVISLPFNLGVGGAMRVAFKYAMLMKFDQVLQIDADGQHLPSEAKKLINVASDSSVVLGSRFLGSENFYKVSSSRRSAMSLLAKIVSFICRTPLTDVTSGFRLSSGSAIPLFASNYPREYLGDTVESLILAHRNKIKIIEVPVLMAPREYGSPSQNLVKSIWHLFRALLVITLAIFKRN